MLSTEWTTLYSALKVTLYSKIKAKKYVYVASENTPSSKTLGPFESINVQIKPIIISCVDRVHGFN